MTHRTRSSPQRHKLETSTNDGEVRGACTCGWHHRGWVYSLAAVREAHERHVAAVTCGPWKPVGRSSMLGNLGVWLVQRDCTNGTTETYRKKGRWLWARPSRFRSEATAQAMADKLNGTREPGDGVEPKELPEAREPHSRGGGVLSSRLALLEK